MRVLKTGSCHRMRYSAAYPTGRERMHEPRYGCAQEALLRRAASPRCTCREAIRFPDERREELCEAKSQEGAASPKGPQGAARERMLSWSRKLELENG